MTGARRVFFATAASALRWFARGEMNAGERLLSWAEWCELRTKAIGEGDPRTPQPP